jgi:hypothetical protein
MLKARRPARFLPFFTLIILTLLGSRASAWCNKEHIQLTRIAAERLIVDPETPPVMVEWLKRAVPGVLDLAGERDYFMHARIGLIPRSADGVLYWATMPDMIALTDVKETKIEPFGVPERLLHFMDLEFFVPDESKRAYHHDLSGKPAVADVPRDMHDDRYLRAGMLPFRVKQCYDELVKAIREDRLVDTPGKYPRDNHAAKWAGYLAHYAEDNTQPHHSTADYKSAAYFADKRNAPNVHAEMEYRMCDDDLNDFMKLREEFWPQFEAALKDVNDAAKSDDPWQATVEVSVMSYDALPLIGLAAMSAAKQAGTPEKPEGKAQQPFYTETFFRFKGTYMGREMTVSEMKAHQTAWAVKRVERLWRAAWDEAHK